MDDRAYKRGGTSQAARPKFALQPESAQVDERSLRDMIRFAMAYAKELRFINSDGTETAGGWQNFLGSTEADLEAIINFFENPTVGSRYQQPHVALFLTFLKLLQYAQDQMNGITRSHLEFYYRQVLGLAQRTAIPDKAHMIVELAPNVDGVILPAGTLLNAGTDRQYRIAETAVINPAQAVDFRSIHALRRVTGIAEARQPYAAIEDQAIVEMFRIVYGDPNPGDDLPQLNAPLRELPSDQRDYNEVYIYLKKLHGMVNFVRDGLFMSLPTFRALMKLKQQQDNDQPIWDEINNILNEVGRRRSNDPNFRLNPQNERAFDDNLMLALGVQKLPEFERIPDVKNIYELYPKASSPEINGEIERNLYMSPDTFYRMMRLKVGIDQDWEEIYRILREAGRKKQGVNALPKLNYSRHKAPPEFSNVLVGALETITWPDGIADIDDLKENLEAIRAYFHLYPEEFAFVMAGKNWEKIDAMLDAAYYERHYAVWRKALRVYPRTHEGFTKMLNYAAGFDLSGEREAALAQLERVGQLDVRNELFAKALKDPADPTLKTDNWETIYGLIESAMRLMRSIPPPEKVEWVNLYADSDIVRDVSWELFGAPKPQRDPLFGWAVRSSMLNLSAGKRTITLRLTFSPTNLKAAAITDVLDRTNNMGSPFVVDVSTEKGWIEADTLLVRQPNNQALEFKLEFSEKADALAPPPGDTLPMLRIRLRQIADARDEYITRYEPFKNLILTAVTLDVDVDGLLPAQMQNDQSALPPKKPFEPFGITPLAGSRFFLAHPELIDKSLKKLTFHVEWMGLPADLRVHYRNYPGVTEFKTAITLVDNGIESKPQSQPLFSSMSTPATKNDLKLEKIDALPLDVITDTDVQNWSRYIQWELESPGFQHDNYPGLAAQMASKLAVDLAKNTLVKKRDANNQETSEVDMDAYKINPPYTPKIKTLTLGYSASAALEKGMFHIHPFGYAAIGRATEGFPFLPQYDFEGEFYLGLSAVQAPQDISLLFQLAGDTPNPDAPPPPIEWSYLSDNQWTPLKVLLDDTDGLLKSGIIRFDLPAAKPGALLPGDLYWLRAAIKHSASGVCNAVGVHTQAVMAVLHTGEVLPDPLPAGTIAELNEPVPGIAAIYQLYPTFGSRIAEPDTMFYTRVSERLRHRQRAVTIWDYEHLILDQFPQVYRVKCLPASDEQPGLVRIIVIPNLRFSLRFDPFAPKAPVSLLREIEEFLSSHAPPYVEIRASNARYVPVKLRFGVRFMPGVNETFYKQRLNDEINQFLSPWAYDQDADIVIGGRIYANTLVNFIEQRDYVDYIAEIRLFRGPDPVRATDEGLWVEPVQPDEVLVADPEHEINIIVDDHYQSQDFEGINYMKIELDFMVGPNA